MTFQMAKINVKKLSSNAQIPVRGTSGAAGFDLFAAQSKTIPARGRDRIFLDIEVRMLKPTYLKNIYTISD